MTPDDRPYRALPEQPSRGLRFKTILVADDSRTVAEVIRVYLIRSDYEFLVAHDGAAAFDIALRTKPDLVISDMKMPVLTGLDLCRKLKRIPGTRNIPFVLISGALTDELRGDAVRAGVTKCFPKPLDAEALAWFVEQTLGNGRHP